MELLSPRVFFQALVATRVFSARSRASMGAASAPSRRASADRSRASLRAQLQGGVPMLRILIPVLDSLNSTPAVRHVDWRVHARRTNGGAPAARPHAAFALCRALDTGRDRAAFHREAAEKVLRPVQELLDGFHIRYTVHVELGDKAAVIVADGAAAQGRPHRDGRSARQLAHPIRRRLGDRKSDRLRPGAG